MDFIKLSLLTKRQWLENRKVYGASALSIAGLLSFLFLITWHWGSSFSGGVNKGIFLIGLFVGGGLFVSLVFRDLGNKSKGMWLLCLPASAAEKLTIAFFIGILSYLLLYTGIFYLVETGYLWLVNDIHTKIGHTRLFENGFYEFVFIYINIQLIILLGSICFTKIAFIKTLLLLIVGFPLVTTANNYALKIITGLSEIDSSMPFSYFQFMHQGEWVYVYLPERAQTAVTLFLNYLLPAALYYIAYLKLREKEL